LSDKTGQQIALSADTAGVADMRSLGKLRRTDRRTRRCFRVKQDEQNVIGTTMKLGSFIEKIRENFSGDAESRSQFAPPTLGSGKRFPYGPFRFKTELPKGVSYEIQVASDLENWVTIAEDVAPGPGIEYVDSEASKYNHRFYRVELFKGWPDGTTFNKFDTRLFRLSDNSVKHGKWTNPNEKLLPGEGGIFLNPTSDYKSLNFVGDVMQGNLSVPIPAGFSLRSSLLPQPGQLHEDLGFPVCDGDVIHLFDRDQQKYVLFPFEGGKWKSGAPVVNICESFWVAKTEAANWTRAIMVDESGAGASSISHPGFAGRSE
jgi:hypothetical protein